MLKSYQLGSTIRPLRSNKSISNVIPKKLSIEGQWRAEQGTNVGGVKFDLRQWSEFFFFCLNSTECVCLQLHRWRESVLCAFEIEAAIGTMLRYCFVLVFSCCLCRVYSCRTFASPRHQEDTVIVYSSPTNNFLFIFSSNQTHHRDEK